MGDEWDDAAPDAAPDAGEPAPAADRELGMSDDGDHLLYELDEWEDDERAALTDALVSAQLPFDWSGATLVVRSRDEAEVERILDAVDEALSLTLDAGEPQVAYDLGEWDDARRAELEVALADAGVPHEWSGNELYVHEEDEQAVDGLIDESGQPVADTAGIDAGTGAELLGELFVAADRLLHDARDHEGTLSLVDGVRMAQAMRAPFGVDSREWSTILESARSLATLVERTDVDDDAVIDAATNLRRMLRPLV